ncbi:dehydrogenase [Fibrobacterales bacterium]|nr:dehydrogenase [Fibrobacterales bacterium]
MQFAIIGTGFMAQQFAHGLQHTQGAELYAMCSRSKETAQAFAVEFGAKKAYSSRESMLADPEVDIVYIATPNHRHAPDSIAALNAGKAVLCEKPFALNSAELESIIAVAKSKKLFLMEALWTGFLPSFRKFLELAKNGTIGEPQILQADFGFNAPFNVSSRLFDPAQGGGSIYDIGIYPLFAAYKLFGYPTKIQSIKIPSPAGTDTTALIQTLHANGKTASLCSSFAVDLDTEANLYGTKGKLTLHKCFHIPTKLTVQNESETYTLEFSEPSNGYQYEATAAINAIENNLTECPQWTLDNSRDIMKMIDEARG